MPLFRRPIDTAELAEKVAAELAKAVPGMGALPRGTTTTDLSVQARTLAGQDGSSIPLPAEDMSGVAFGPGLPIRPRNIDPREPDRPRPEPRVSQFPVSVNTQISDRMVPFQTLRDVADQVDVIRRCIEVRKAQLLSLEWNFTISKRTLKQIMADDPGITSPGKAAQIARERYATAIGDAEAFWRRPDPLNGLDFGAWLSMLLEEMFVIDAVTVYPRFNRRGDLLSFELLDGATIKPLLDHRGAVPQPPHPAYQQILFGFPRGEFTTSSDDRAIPYEYDHLVYRPRNRRTFTPYGFSNVEQACSVADLYLKRTDWIRREFTDGVLPAALMKTTGKMSPDQLRDYEEIYNEELAGQTAERKGIRVLPDGFDPIILEEWAKKYSPDFDEFLIKLACACFDVMPTEIGFPPKSGIGGKGHQEGEENTTYRKAIRPTVTWLSSLINELSYTYLGVPREIEQTFVGFEVEDQLEVVQMHDLEVRGGQSTINEVRASKGQPLFDFPEADTPFLVTGAGIQFLPNATAAITGAGVAELDPVAGVASEPEAIAPPPEPAAAVVPIGEEVAKFVRFAKKRHGAWRDFSFEHPDLCGFSSQLNDWGQRGDLDKIAAWARPFLGKAKARPDRAALVDTYTARLLAALKGMWSGDLAAEWQRVQSATKARDPDRLAAARGFVAQHQGDPPDALMGDLAADGFDLGDFDMADLVGGVPAGHDNARFQVVVGTASVSAAAIVAVLADRLAKSLTDHATSNAETAVSAIFDNEDLWLAPWVQDRIDGALTEPVTQGKVAAADANGVTRVRLVASAGACSFCADYDGRILTLPDDESGLPPLHEPSCNCDIEPLTEETT